MNIGDASVAVFSMYDYVLLFVLVGFIYVVVILVAG